MFASDRDVDTSYVVADFRTLKNLPIFVFGFTCHQNIFAVNNELRDPTRRRLDMVVMGAVSLALAFYLVIANAGYATFGASIHSDVLPVCENYAIDATGGASTHRCSPITRRRRRSPWRASPSPSR